MTFREAIRTALAEAMEADPAVVLLGEDIGVYGGAFGVTRGLIDRFGPDRVIDLPISENTFAGMAAGMALEGMRPVVEFMFADFMLLAADQILNHAAKFPYIYGGNTPLPVVYRAPYGAGRGYGPSHSQSVEALFLSLPGLTVIIPANARDAHDALRHAIASDRPTLFLESKLLYGREEEDLPPLPPGKSRIRAPGDDVTVVAWGRMVELALEARERADCGVEVIDPRWLSPLDGEGIAASVRRTGRLVVVEEGHTTGGFGGEIVAQIAESCPGVLRAVVRVGAADTPIPAGRELECSMLPDLDRVSSAIRRVRSW